MAFSGIGTREEMKSKVYMLDMSDKVFKDDNYHKNEDPQGVKFHCHNCFCWFSFCDYKCGVI